jgi:hypothetical protein
MDFSDNGMGVICPPLQKLVLNVPFVFSGERVRFHSSGFPGREPTSKEKRTIHRTPLDPKFSGEQHIRESKSVARRQPRANFATAHVDAGTAHQSFASLRASHPVEKVSKKDGQKMISSMTRIH